MENLVKKQKAKVMNLECFKGKKVLITGNTGFKGSWLSLWLHLLGAKVTGCALSPVEARGLFKVGSLHKIIGHNIIDIRDRKGLCELINYKKPEIVFHLAAQALVLESYSNPIETFEVNTLGTANVLEAIRHATSVKAAIMITTDKCYENHEWEWPYRENEPMGGHDPYSASKGAAELIISSYRKSFFSKPGSPAIASVRAGNVIGGGDFAANRILPDIIRSIERNEPILVRNPNSVRPWQHVLDPLGGYLLLAAHLLEHPIEFAEAWNFGPKTGEYHPVSELVKKTIEVYGKGSWVDFSGSNQSHEAKFLSLDISKAFYRLGWQPILSFAETIFMTTEWYKKSLKGTDMLKYSIGQIKSYEDKWKLLD
jgi:CDP-glucose 4,6-dehydratase